jgi:predicted nucleotidyltransferase
MKEGKDNEAKALLALFREFSVDYNANSLSKVLNITPMGALKILKRLEKEQLIIPKQMGKAVFYRIDFDNDYARTYLKFALQKEAEQSSPRVRRWVEELRKFKGVADIGILFGSVLEKADFNDVDVVLVFEEKKAGKISSLLKDISGLSVKRIHLVRQTTEDFESNLKGRDKVLLSALKRGIVMFGYDGLIEVVASVSRR